MKSLILAMLLIISGFAFASQCDQLFPNGKEIVIPGTTILCNSFYVILFDESKKASILSADVTQTHTVKVERKNDFHPDARLKDSPKPSDYAKTGYDKGHMTPAGDSATDLQMHETFLMSNMTPQRPTCNRLGWKYLEEKVRTEPTKYVVTGATYATTGLFIGPNHNIPVPVSYYKVVYKTDGSLEAFVADNVDNCIVTSIPVADLEKKTGITFPK